MYIEQLLVGVIGWLVESPENSVLAATMLVVGHHVRKASALGGWMSMAGVAFIILALGTLFGIVEIDFSALGGIVNKAVSLAT